MEGERTPAELGEVRITQGGRDPGLGQGGELLADVENILGDVHQVTEMLAKNKGKIEASLSHIEHAADDLSRMSKTVGDMSAKGGKIDQIGDELLQTMHDVREVTATLNNGMGDLLRSLTNTSQVVAQQLTAVSQSLSDSARAASVTLQRYDSPRTLIGGPHPSALGPGEAR